MNYVKIKRMAANLTDSELLRKIQECVDVKYWCEQELYERHPDGMVNVESTSEEA